MPKKRTGYACISCGKWQWIDEQKHTCKKDVMRGGEDKIPTRRDLSETERISLGFFIESLNEDDERHCRRDMPGGFTM